MQNIDFNNVMVEAPSAPSPRQAAEADISFYLETREPVCFKDAEGAHCVIGSNKKGLVIRQNHQVIFNSKDFDAAVEAILNITCH